MPHSVNDCLGWFPPQVLIPGSGCLRLGPLTESEAVMPVGEGSDVVDRRFTLLLEASYVDSFGFCV